MEQVGDFREQSLFPAPLAHGITKHPNSNARTLLRSTWCNNYSRCISSFITLTRRVSGTWGFVGKDEWMKRKNGETKLANVKNWNWGNMHGYENENHARTMPATPLAKTYSSGVCAKAGSLERHKRQNERIRPHRRCLLRV